MEDVPAANYCGAFLSDENGRALAEAKLMTAVWRHVSWEEICTVYMQTCLNGKSALPSWSIVYQGQYAEEVTAAEKTIINTFYSTEDYSESVIITRSTFIHSISG